jgi:hypothetical protein
LCEVIWLQIEKKKEKTKTETKPPPPPTKTFVQGRVQNGTDLFPCSQTHSGFAFLG